MQKNNKTVLFLFLYLALFITLCFVRKSLWVSHMDHAIYSMALQLSYSETWLKFWYVITIFGTGTFVYCLLGALFLYLVGYSGQWRLFGYCVFLAVLFLTVPGFKYLFALERPVGFASFYPDLTSYTFPSGHAFNSVVLFYFIPRLSIWIFKPRSENLFYQLILSWPFMVLGILLINFSRVFLGVHWFSDVIGGSLWGAALTILAVILYKRMMDLRE